MENDELLQQFLAQYSSSSNTRDAYRRDLQQFTEFLGGKPLRQLSSRDIGTFASYLLFHQWRRAGQCGRYSASTQARKLDAVRAFIRWLVGEGVCNVPGHELAAATAVDRREYNRLRRDRRRT